MPKVVVQRKQRVEISREGEQRLVMEVGVEVEVPDWALTAALLVPGAEEIKAPKAAKQAGNLATGEAGAEGGES